MSRREWTLIICGGLVLFLCLGQRHAFGLYLLPVTSEWAWSRETFSVAVAVQNLVWGLAQPFSGMWADRRGARPVLMVGGVLYAAGLLLMPWSQQGLVFAFTVGLLVGLGQSGTGFAIVYGTVGKAFDAGRRARALAITGAIGGAGQFLMLPFNQVLIAEAGWVVAVLVASMAMAAMVPLAWGMRMPVAPATPAVVQSLRSTLSQAFGDRDFWLLTLGFLSCGFQLAFIANHLPAYLADHGQPARVASLALGLVALANIVGTYLFGMAAARLPHKHLLALLYGARTVAILAFVAWPLSSWSVYAFAAAMGFTWLGTVPLTTGLLGQLYGVRYVTTLFGFAFLSHQIGSFLGVWLGGWWYDSFGGYRGIWWMAAALSLVSAGVNLPIRERAAAQRLQGAG